MDKEIICSINLFTVEQQIYYNGKKIMSVDLNNLADALIANCIRFNLNKIHLFGDEQFISELIPQINEYKEITIDIKIN